MLTNIDKLTHSGCEREQKDKVCRLRGGESCAFDGAMIVLQPIADAAHIVHGPIACCGNSWEGRGTLSSTGNLHRMGFTTDINEMDIVYGSEKKLHKAIVQTYEKVRPKAIFVYATCVSGLIGEDIESVCKKAESELGVRVIPVNAPGFVGPKNLGNRIAGEVLLDHVIGAGEMPKNPPVPPFVKGGTSHISPLKKGDEGGFINLIGEYNIAGDLWLVEPVLKAAGIRILSRITGDSTFEEITYAHRAKLNVVVCSRALINVAKEMEKRYGIPYIEVSFFGKTEMSKALRRIAQKVQKSEVRSQKSEAAPGFSLQDSVEAIIIREEKQLAKKLKAYSHLKGKKAVLYTGGVKSWSFISALLDLGIEIVAVGTKKSTFEDEEKMKDILGEDALLVEDVTPKNLLKLMKEKNADILVAGGRNQYLAIKEGFPFIDINQERHTAYAGYEGLVNLAEQISNSVRFYEEHESYVSYKTYAAQRPEKSVVINPLKHSQAIGAAIAFQGINNSIPVIHGAQGCTFLGKVLLTKHFREPIALQSTKLFTEDVVMGSDENLAKTIEGIIEKNNSDVIGVLTSGLSEVKGDDVKKAVSSQRSAVSDQNKECFMVHVSTPDYEGGLETGYANAVEAVIESIISNREATKFIIPACRESSFKNDPGQAGMTEQKCSYVRTNRLINVLAGSHLTPADFTELREIIEAFGLRPVILPDLSALDGSRQGLSALAIGGTKVDDIRWMSQSAFTFAIGASMGSSAKLLHEKFGIEYSVIESLSGLNDTDTFIQTLSFLSGAPVPARYERQRRILIDGMRDAHFYFGSKKICLAIEPDMAVQTSRWISEMGAEITLAVIPQNAESAGNILAKEVVVSDLFSIDGEFDLLISNSHAEDTAKRLGIPLYQMGFPVYKIIGNSSKITIGYRGTLAMINEAANLLLLEKHVSVSKSPFTPLLQSGDKKRRVTR
ncbi:MAG: nitrogenase iron-molybdenum cofactor biosynthesis protein NifE [Nitrospirae bacterium]|nr:nitrogenase iron-molybdenum cofactor biosynthesis protein NifE [Nitrospirota bacterium]